VQPSVIVGAIFVGYIHWRNPESKETQSHSNVRNYLYSQKLFIGGQVNLDEG
jgi:hypothetical protein